MKARVLVCLPHGCDWSVCSFYIACNYHGDHCDHCCCTSSTVILKETQLSNDGLEFATQLREGNLLELVLTEEYVGSCGRNPEGSADAVLDAYFDMLPA